MFATIKSHNILSRNRLIKIFSSLIVLALIAQIGFARDWYVSASRGSGHDGTLEKPAKDLGNIISKLEEGDRVFIAAGIYTGRGDNGHDLITVPIEIYGGFSDTFAIDNGRSSKGVVLNNNLRVSSLDAAYREFDTEMGFEDIESVKASDTAINALRSMLGLNLEDDDLNLDSDVWLMPSPQVQASTWIATVHKCQPLPIALTKAYLQARALGRKSSPFYALQVQLIKVRPSTITFLNPGIPHHRGE